jgi:hypothetical protein
MNRLLKQTLMDAVEVWQSPTQDNSIKEGLSKYQAQYLRIIRRTIFLKDRFFHLGMTVLTTICALVLTYMSPFQPYSIIGGFVLAAMQWYVFVLYERLRTRIKDDADERDPLAYFRRKLDIITQIAYIRWITLISAVLFLLGIWATFSRGRLFDQRSIGLWIWIVVITAVGVVYQLRRVKPVVIYLGIVVRDLEEKNAQLQRENN